MGPKAWWTILLHKKYVLFSSFCNWGKVSGIIPLLKFILNSICIHYGLVECKTEYWVQRRLQTVIADTFRLKILNSPHFLLHSLLTSSFLTLKSRCYYRFLDCPYTAIEISCSVSSLVLPFLCDIGLLQFLQKAFLSYVGTLLVMVFM